MVPYSHSIVELGPSTRVLQAFLDRARETTDNPSVTHFRMITNVGKGPQRPRQAIARQQSRRTLALLIGNLRTSYCTLFRRHASA